jgi:hypothetical protein
LLAVIVQTSLASAAEEKARVFRAGAYAQDITPTKLPVSVNGGFSDRIAKTVHDRLHARCLVLDDGTTRLAIVICDSCMIPREIIDRARELAEKATGIPAGNMLISATHTHTAPTVAGVFQSEPNSDYAEELPGMIAAGIKKAHEARVPARIGWGVGQEPNQVFNRRWFMKPNSIPADPFDGTTDRVKMNPGHLNPGLVKPAGPVDPEVSVLYVQSREGKPLAVLANYSLHYVGGVPALSADYFGLFAERLQSLMKAEKSEFVGILSNGTSGDVNNVNFAKAAEKRQPGEQARLVADAVARVTARVCGEIKLRDWVSLAAANQEITLGVRLPSEKDIARAREILEQARDKKVLTTSREVYARETVLLAKYPAKVKVRLQALRIGDLGIAAIPCEVFTEIGLEIKKKSPLKPSFTIELANGYNGYLPTPEQHKLGGYETWRARSSYLEVEASTKITATILDLLKQVAKS